MNKIVSCLCFMAIIGLTFADIKQWNNFKQRFGKNKKYNDPVEDKIRYALFKKNMKLINACNQDTNSTTRCGVTYTSDWTETEMKSMIMSNKPKLTEILINETRTVRDITKDCYRTRSYPDSSICRFKRNPSVNLPKSFDVEEYFTIPIQNQNKEEGCGCCWTMSVTDSLSLAEDYQTRKPSRKPEKPLKTTLYSAQELIDCDHGGINNGCSGGDQGLGYEYIKRNGISTSIKYPYIASKVGYKQSECKKNQFDKNPNKFKSMEYVRVEENTEAVMEALVTYGSCSASLMAAVPGKFQSLKGKVVYDGKSTNGGMECNEELNHAVTLVGYTMINGILAFKVRNSWGSDWGDDGHFYLREICGILKEVRCPVFNE